MMDLFVRLKLQVDSDYISSCGFEDLSVVVTNAQMLMKKAETKVLKKHLRELSYEHCIFLGNT